MPRMHQVKKKSHDMRTNAAPKAMRRGDVVEAHATLLHILTAAAAAFCGAGTHPSPMWEEQRWWCLSVCSGGFSGPSECTALSMHSSLAVDSLVNTCLNTFPFMLLLCSVFELTFQMSILYLLKFFFFIFHMLVCSLICYCL